MQHESPRSTGALARSRTTIVLATAVVLLLLGGTWATVALALPPGGAVENRDGASITLGARIVKPVTDGEVGSGLVTFTGTGFAANEVLLVKLDDGAVAPNKATRPPKPDNVTPQSDDWIAIAVADGAGVVPQTTVDLRNVATPADAATVAAGKHLLRFVSSRPRSIHADFAVSPTLPVPETLRANRTTLLGPGESNKVAETPARTYDGIPKLLPGSTVPYALSGYLPGQTITIKNRDGANLVSFVTDGDGKATGSLAIPSSAAGDVGSTGGVSWFRVQGGATNGTTPVGTNSSTVLPYAVDAAASARSVAAGASAQRGRGLAITGTGLQKELFYLPIGGVPAGDAGANTGSGQTITARLDGTGPPIAVRANDGGALAGSLPIPAGTALGTHTVTIDLGYRAASDFPQASYARTFEVTEFVPDPVVTPPADTTPPATAPVVTPPAAAPAVPTTPVATAVPAPVAPRATAISTSALKATKQGRVTLSLVRPSAATKATVSVTTKAKVRVAGRRAKKLVTLVKAKTVTLKAGTAKQRTTLSLTLTTEGRAVLKKAKTLKVVVRVVPATKGARAITRTVNLRG